MPINKSPELIRTETLARIGAQLTSAISQAENVGKLLTEGFPGSPQQNLPAIPAADIKAVLGVENTDKLLRIAAAAGSAVPVAPTEA